MTVYSLEHSNLDYQEFYTFKSAKKKAFEIAKKTKESVFITKCVNSKPVCGYDMLPTGELIKDICTYNGLNN